MERKKKKETDELQNNEKLFIRYKNLFNLNNQRTNYHNLNKKQQKKNKEKKIKIKIKKYHIPLN